MVKRVCCLYRVSTKGQLVQNDIPMQKIACSDFIGLHGWEVVKEYSEKGISGSKVSAVKRDAIQAIKNDILQGRFDVLVVFMFDRLGRREDETPFVLEWVVKHGIEVWSTQEGQQRFDSHVDKLLNYIRFWQASGESEKTAIRIRTRHEQLTREGIWRGGVPPFGYCLVHNGRMSKKGVPVPDMAIDESKVKIVRELFSMMAYEGYGTHRLAAFLNENYLNQNKAWRASTINRIIDNPVYTGRLSFGELITEPKESLRIIDDYTFEHAKAIMHERAPWKHSNVIPMQTGTKRLLNGLLYCGHCGQRLVGSVSREKRKRKDGSIALKERPIYRCYGRETHGCAGQSLYSARRIELAVDESIQAVFKEILLITPDEAEAHISTVAVKEARIHAADVERERSRLLNEEQLIKDEILLALRGESALGKDVLNAMAADTRTKLDDVLRQYETACQALTDVEQEVKDRLHAFNELTQWAAEFKSSSIERKRMILFGLIKLVTVSRDYDIKTEYKKTVLQYL